MNKFIVIKNVESESLAEAYAMKRVEGMIEEGEIELNYASSTHTVLRLKHKETVLNGWSYRNPSKYTRFVFEVVEVPTGAYND